jgi:hypothetical protein
MLRTNQTDQLVVLEALMRLLISYPH